ncbi:SIMPL domain-containing protein [Candidatus Woesearchaeota archaeon]|jgi:uncharacterized protein|nr:SIMPL domain-containing protein [Candidatus Woesearchaeota archaeon]
MKHEENKLHKNLAHLVVLALIVVIVVLSFGRSSIETLSVTQTDTNIIKVSSDGEITVEPDKATSYVEITTLKTTANAAQEENAKLSDQVIAALKEKGIDESDIETNSFNLYPKQEWNRDTEKSELVGYEVTHSLKIETKNIDQVGDYLDTAIKAGANRVNRISFGLSDEKSKEVKSQALDLAAKNAKTKAQNLAKSLDINLVKITQVYESETNYYPIEKYPMMSASFAESKVMDSSVNLQPSDVEVSAQVTLVYEIA